MKKISFQNTTWVDLNRPTQNNLDKIKKEFNLNSFIVEQFLPQIHRPKIEEYPNQLFLVLHFPVVNSKKKHRRTIELDLIITPKALITSHRDKIPSMESFIGHCQKEAGCQKEYFKSSGHLLFHLLDWLIDSCLPTLDKLGEKVEKIETQVFQGKEKEMLTEIASVKRDLIDFRRAIKPQRSILDILEKKTTRLFDKELRPLAQEVVGSVIRVWNTLENHQELVNSIEQTNNSLLSHKLNDIMKFLTVVSFITFPLSVIVGFFGMNVFGTLPIVRNNSYAWVIILASMASITLAMILYFKRKKWL